MPGGHLSEIYGTRREAFSGWRKSFFADTDTDTDMARLASRHTVQLSHFVNYPRIPWQQFVRVD